MDRNQEKLYENATKKLLQTIDKMGLDKMLRIRAKNLTLLFRDSFKLPNVRYATLYPDIKDIDDGTGLDVFKYYSDGFCRASSNAFAGMMSAVDYPNYWQIMYISEVWTFGPHHYILHKPSKTVFDLTHDQYINIDIKDIPYDIGVPVPMLLQPNEGPDRFLKSLGIDLIQEIKRYKE